jgi:hypothetical protein
MIKTFEQHSQSEINSDTKLKLKKEWISPYNNLKVGDNSDIETWSRKSGKTVQVFIKDFKNGSLDDWFEEI